MESVSWLRLAAAPIVLIIGLSVACGETKSTARPESPAPGATLTARSVGDHSGLTEDERALVEEEVANDGRVQEIIGDREYIIENIIPWFGGGEKFAGIAIVEWDEPLTVTYEWPTTSYRDHYEHYGPELGLRPYRESVIEFTVHGLTGLEVRVDLQEQRVIGIEPGAPPSAYERIEQPEGFVFDLTAEEREQALNIFHADERVQAILTGRDYRIRHVSGWTGGNTRFAGVTVGWDDREDIEADWPLLIDVDPETWELSVHTAHFTAETVGQLAVLIDLDAQQVITIEPSVGD